MGCIQIKINKVENDKTEELVVKSKFFGTPAFPQGFFKKNKLDGYYYLAQINLQEVTPFDINSELPSTGMLYFFVNETKFPYDVRVIYTKEELKEIYDDINDPFRDKIKNAKAYMLSFIDDADDTADCCKLLGTPGDEPTEINASKYKLLLQIDPLSVPEDFPSLGVTDGYTYIMLEPKALVKQHFDHVIMISHEL